MKALRFLACAAATALLLSSCSSLLSGFSPSSLFDTAVGAAMGDPSDTAKVNQLQQVGQAVSKATEEITPEQEYYIGRAVAATVLQTYKPWDVKAVTQYLTALGKGLAMASTLPETFSGYHFLALDTDDINAFGAPSGFILVSRGLLRCATTEDEVAAVLAHEIGHVALKHGLGAISNARWTEAALQLGKFAAQNSDVQVLRDLTNSFGDVIGDITKTLVTSGYSRELEKQADLEAVRILHDVGYDPRALERVLTAMKARLKPGAKDFAATHPDPDTRIAYVEKAVAEQTPVPAAAAAQSKARQARFAAALSKI
jgi:beta-barrel assembly-enhancing protease